MIRGSLAASEERRVRHETASLASELDEARRSSDLVGANQAAPSRCTWPRRSSLKSADLDVLSDSGSSSSGGTEVSLRRRFSLGSIPTFVGADGADDNGDQANHSVKHLAVALKPHDGGGRGGPSPESTSKTSRISPERALTSTSTWGFCASHDGGEPNNSGWELAGEGTGATRERQTLRAEHQRRLERAREEAAVAAAAEVAAAGGDVEAVAAAAVAAAAAVDREQIKTFGRRLAGRSADRDGGGPSDDHNGVLDVEGSDDKMIVSPSWQFPRPSAQDFQTPAKRNPSGKFASAVSVLPPPPHIEPGGGGVGKGEGAEGGDCRHCSSCGSSKVAAPMLGKAPGMTTPGTSEMSDGAGRYGGGSRGNGTSRHTSARLNYDAVWAGGLASSESVRSKSLIADHPELQDSHRDFVYSFQNDAVGLCGTGSSALTSTSSGFGHSRNSGSLRGTSGLDRTASLRGTGSTIGSGHDGARDSSRSERRRRRGLLGGLKKGMGVVWEKIAADHPEPLRVDKTLTKGEQRAKHVRQEIQRRNDWQTNSTAEQHAAMRRQEERHP